MKTRFIPEVRKGFETSGDRVTYFFMHIVKNDTPIGFIKFKVEGMLSIGFDDMFRCLCELATIYKMELDEFLPILKRRFPDIAFQQYDKPANNESMYD